MTENHSKQEENADKLTVKEPEKDDEKVRNNYFCPLEGCKEIPEIENARCEIGKIIMYCRKYKKLIYLDVEEYFKILDGEGKIKIDPEDNNYCIPKSNSRQIENLKEKVFKSRNVLIENKRVKDLCNIIRALNQIVDTQEKHPDNYLHNKNVLNIAEYIDKENFIMTYENKNYSTYDIIEEMESRVKEEEQALKNLEKYQVYLGREHINEDEFHLNLSCPKNKKDDNGQLLYPQLENEGFKLITQIRFKNLIEINVAYNNIEDMTPLDNMLLPHLEIINLSDNQIKKIQSVANLQSTYLSEIYLQNNQIEDLGPFLNSQFDYLEMFRVDNNKKAIDKENFQAVKEKYKNNLYYKALDWNNFIEEYHCYELGNNFDSNKFTKEAKLDLGSRRCGDKILLDLRPLIIYPNILQKLILDDNKLQNLSLLNRMRFPNLIELDLSLNLITNIRFIKKLSKTSKHLKALYLNDNKINDISPLIAYREKKEVKNDNIDNENKEVNKNEETKKEEKEKVEGIIFEKLEVLTLDNNCLDEKDKTTKEILNKLKNMEQLSLDYELKPEENEQENTQQQNNPNNDNDNNNLIR